MATRPQKFKENFHHTCDKIGTNHHTYFFFSYSSSLTFTHHIMGKRANKRQANNGSNWTHEKHEERVHRKVAKLDNENDPNKEEEQDENPTRKKLKGYERSIHLSHDSYEKKQVSKLRLHISKMKREIEALRKRLSTWDELEEQAAFRKKIEVEKEAKKRLENEASNPDAKKRRNKRLGPETWKLRGAARPAYEGK